MFPLNRLFWIAGFLSIVLLSNAGCGQKRIHVATTSGTPGVEEELTPGLSALTELSDQSGLENSDLTEAGLGAELGSGESSDPDPSMFATESSGLPEEMTDTSEPQMSEEFASMTPPQQEIQTNPSSEMAPEMEKSNSDDQMPQTALNGNSSAENVAGMEEPEANTSSQGDSLHQEDGSQDIEAAIEEVPENVVVAKAEPSEAIQRQLEQMREEEVATVAAGVQDVFFEFDSWTITPEGKDALEHDADWLKDQMSALILIEGHCDDRGTQAYNLVLGKKRAVAIRDYLVELGVDSSRLGFISYGKDKPFCSDPTEVCYQLNRRGRLVVQKP